MPSVIGDGSDGNADQPTNVCEVNRKLVLALLHHVSTYFHLDDPGVYLFALAVAVSTSLEGDPLWGMIVGAASGGKTEVLRVLDGIAARAVDTLTAAALIYWHRLKPGSAPRRKGILVDVGDRGLVTIGDFSTVLQGSPHGRDETYSLLRRVFDGEVQRDLANGDGSPLKWEGRVTIFACCTSAIDNFASHTDALGPRWIYYRQRQREMEGKRRVLRKARKADKVPVGRTLAAKLAEMVVGRAILVIEDVDLSEAASELIEDAALVTAFGRGSVPRDNYRREIDGIPETEEPTRVAKQLAMLARCLMALGLTEAEAVGLACRVALDSIPQIRERVLATIAEAEAPIDSATVAKALNYDPKTVTRALTDFAALGLVESTPASKWAEAAEEIVGASKPWRMVSEHADLVRRVMGARQVPHLQEFPVQP